MSNKTTKVDPSFLKIRNVACQRVMEEHTRSSDAAPEDDGEVRQHAAQHRSPAEREGEDCWQHSGKLAKASPTYGELTDRDATYSKFRLGLPAASTCAHLERERGDELSPTRPSGARGGALRLSALTELDEERRRRQHLQVVFPLLRFLTAACCMRSCSGAAPAAGTCKRSEIQFIPGCAGT